MCDIGYDFMIITSTCRGSILKATLRISLMRIDEGKFLQKKDVVSILMVDLLQMLEIV